MYNVSNNTSTLTVKTNPKKAVPKKNDPPPDNNNNAKRAAYVNTWKIEDFSRRLEANTPILSPTFTHKFGAHTLQCKVKLYSAEAHNGTLVVESHVEPRPPKNTSVKVECCLRDANDRETRLSRASESDDSRFKHVIQRALLADKRLIANDVLTVLVKINVERASQGLYDSVKDARLADDFASLLQSGSYSDVKLVVDERTIDAHKGILSCRSSVFAAMFQEERSDVVEIKNFSYEVVNELMRFCYTGTVTKISRELLRASDEFDMAGLKIICEDVFAKHLRISIAAMVLILADRCHAQTLRRKAVEFIVEHFKEVAKTADFKLLTKAVILEIINAWSSK